MKTTKQIIYAKFCEYTANGVSYSIFDENMREYMDKEPNRKFVCEIEIPLVDRSEVVHTGISAIDTEIARHAKTIADLTAKKQQLLCLEHTSEAV